MMFFRTKARSLLFVAFLVFGFLSLGGCSRVKDIEIISCNIESLTPRGLHGISADLSLEVKNPAMQLALSEIEGTIFYQGNPVVVYEAEDVVLLARTTAQYPLPCEARLAEGVSLMRILSIVAGYELSDFTTDIEAQVRLKSGVGKKVKFKDISIEKLLR